MVVSPTMTTGILAPADAAFLGVERSFSGRRWRARLTDDRIALALCQRLDVPELVGRVMAGRGIGLDEAEIFLNPTLRDLLPDPSHLKDMDAAVERLVAAVSAGEQICVFGDYDVDGATSSALLQRFFAAAGARVRVYIPDRAEGYGPSVAALRKLKDEGVSVVVTVDCGVTAFEPLEAAAAAGLDVVVVDHHGAEPALPKAVAVVNPNRLDETSPHGHMAAVGVAFLLVVAVNRGLKAAGWYGAAAGPDLMRWLDLVALGTVCDVVPLVGVNRALVAQGLKVAAKRGNAGLAALADVAGVRERLDAYHLGYLLGPRVNAGGRVGNADLGARLLACDDPAEAAELARRLDEFNRERQEIEAAVLDQAVAQAEAMVDESGPVLVAAGDGWHAGVIGIVAGRLKERFGRPALVIAFEGDEGKGSGRSVPGLDLGTTVIAARQAGILSKGGGHAMAAGFSLARERLADFRAFLAERFRDLDAGALAPSLSLDGALDAAAASLSLVDGLRRLGPFGSGNAEPRFAVTNARVQYASVVGNGHVRCTLSGPRGGRVKAIAFRAAESELGHGLLNAAGAPLHVAGCLRHDTWNGANGVQMFIDDAAAVRG